MGIFKRGRDGGVAPAYEELRSAALDAGPTLGAPSPAHPDVLGAVIDIPREGGAFITLVVLTDGTTSMHTSAGGGVLGSGGHDAVLRSSRTLLIGIQSNLILFPPDKDRALPAAGFVRYTVLTPAGQRVAHVPEGAFWGEEESPVADLIAETQAVISRLREANA